MQFEKLITEKILSNQNQKDETIGTCIKMNNNIIEEFAVDDKFILLHTVRVKQKNKRLINILIDGCSPHTIINPNLFRNFTQKNMKFKSGFSREQLFMRW